MLAPMIYDTVYMLAITVFINIFNENLFVYDEDFIIPLYDFRIKVV